MAKEKTDKKAKTGNASGLMDFLREKKRRDGRLNKLGEWLLSCGGDTGLYVKRKDMRAVLK